jgi:hypothetical protein
MAAAVKSRAAPMEVQPWQDEVNQSRTASASSKLMRNAKKYGKNRKSGG